MLVFFGAIGDLFKCKIFLVIYNLVYYGCLGVLIIGVVCDNWIDEVFC